MELIDKLLKVNLNPVENRFNYAEGNKPVKNHLIGVLKTIVRGGLIGGFTGAVVSDGDIKYSLVFVGVGAALDCGQDALRKINLRVLKRNNQEEYEIHKNKYRIILKNIREYIIN